MQRRADDEHTTPQPNGDGEAAEEGARRTLQSGPKNVRYLRRFWRFLPSEPRCKLCHRPFNGVGGAVMRAIGLGPWPANAKYCSGCFRGLYRHRRGAEIECSLIFADVRGSTHLAETMRAREFRARMDRFYEVAFRVLVDHDAIVDKFVGDEVIGIFVPAMTEELHTRRAVEAGRALLVATGHDTDSPWVPVGVGVHTGIAYVGAVGTAEHVEFTALGDVVNVTARLASAAGPGEILVTDAAQAAARIGSDGLERRHLELKGKTDATDVVVVTATGPLPGWTPGDRSA